VPMEPITNLTGNWHVELSRTSNPVGGSYGQTVTTSIRGPLRVQPRTGGSFPLVGGYHTDVRDDRSEIVPMTSSATAIGSSRYGR